MLSVSPNLSRRCLPCVLTLALGAGVFAQVPDGWYVTGGIQAPLATTPIPGPGGIHLVHPRSGVYQKVLGLPGSLEGIGNAVSGTNAVIYHRPTGAIVAGDVAFGGGTAYLWVLYLNSTPSGPSVDWMRSFQLALGVSVGGIFAAVDQMHTLPNGRVLFVGRGFSGAPMQNEILGIADLQARTVTPVVSTGRPPIPPNFPIAMAFDPGTQQIFVEFWSNVGAHQLASVPLAGGAFILRGNFGATNAMHMDGSLLAFLSSTTWQLNWLDPVTLTVVRTLPVPTWYAGFVPEPVTGGYMLTGTSNSVPPFSIRYMNAQGGTTLVAIPTTPWGTPATIDWSPNPAAFGQPSPLGGPQHEWHLSPNPGGLPTSGNLAFAVQVAERAGPLLDPCFWFASFAPPTGPWQPLPGLQILLAPGSIMTGGFLDPAAPSPGTISLPIPGVPGLIGLSLYVQTLHASTAGALSASEGVKITVL